MYTRYRGYKLEEKDGVWKWADKTQDGSQEFSSLQECKEALDEFLEKKEEN